MQKIFFLWLIFFSIQSMAQDDFPDYRSKKDNFIKLQDKDIRNDISSFAMAGIDESMGKLPLENLPVSAFGNKYISFSGENIRVTVTGGVFLPTNHKLNYYDKYLVRIDNKPYIGNYGKVLSAVIQSVTVIADNDTIPVPADAFSDIYDPVFTYTDASGNTKSHNNVYISADKRKIYIYLLNVNVPGGYEVTWVIEDKKYVRRVVDFGFLK